MPMTDLEERVREALRAQAETLTASPDAWHRVAARAGGRPSWLSGSPARQRLADRLLPLAAAAAVLAVGIGMAVVTEVGGWGAILRGPGPATARTPQETMSTGQTGPRWSVSACATFPGTVGAPAGGPVEINGLTLGYFRVTNAKPATHLDGLWFCALGPGGVATRLPALDGKTLAAEAGSGSTHFGAVVRSATSVEAELANGRQVRGTVQAGRGAPYAVWLVKYPVLDTATLVFRNAAGHVLTRLPLDIPPPVSPLNSPQLLPPAADQCQSASSQTAAVRVPQVMDGIRVWTYVRFGLQHGSEQLMLCEMTGVADSQDGFSFFAALPPGQVVRYVGTLDLTGTLSGTAAPSVTSVTAVLPDGREYGGTLVKGPGFAYQVWLVSYPVTSPATLVFRDAVGRQVAVLHAQANRGPVS
jgi:hypothetical protein